MGIADLVPGVSGGTIALISGIYQRLIHAIAAANISTLKAVFKGQISTTWKHIDGWFLLVLLAGILSAVFLFASLIKHLLSHHAVLTWSFFFGLIICSAVLLIRQNPSKHIFHWLLLTLGILLGYFLSTQSMGALPSGYAGIFVAGMVAISAMILPGITGSLILILLGKYQTVLHAVEVREWTTLLVFSAGCLVGLLAFVRLLKWLLNRFYQATLYTLAGLMLGTLFRVWPWKSIHGNIWPTDHAQPQFLYAVLLMTAASVFVWLLFKSKEE